MLYTIASNVLSVSAAVTITDVAVQQRRRMKREQAAVSAASSSSSSGGSMGVTRPWYCTLQQWTTDFGAKGSLATTIRYY